MSFTGMMTGCSSTPASNRTASQDASLRQAPEPAPVPVVRKAEPLQVATGKSSANPVPTRQDSRYLAEKSRQENLRLQYNRSWVQEREQAQEQARQQQTLQAQARKDAEQARQAAEQARQAAEQARQQQEQQKQQLVRQREQQELARQRQAYHDRYQQQQAAQARQQQTRQQQATQTRQQQQTAAQARQQQQVRTARQTAGNSHIGYGGHGSGNYHAEQISGDFAGNKELYAFVEKMVRKDGFDRGYLYGVFSRVRNRDEVARLWAGNNGGATTPGGWYNYRAKFVTPDNIRKGTQFWQQHAVHLQRASQRYGVDPEYIVGIMGVETRWGRIFGKHRVIDALTTSAVVNKRRSNFFFSELENYLLMTRSERMDPLEPMGSYAGAMGYGQFMPSSFRSFAVDFDGDGIKDLWNPVDAIGSIANYFAKHGWRNGQAVAVPAQVSSQAYASMADGYKVLYSPSRLEKNGIQPASGQWSKTPRTHLLALTTVPGGVKEPWIGYHNFYVITRYNHSNYYAMAVHQLAQSVKQQVGGYTYASR
ncbi:MAG TPA: lytic murein transglycosylase B [Thiolinea sp.]|nr:lytic murein transglycosylase B [Thiolinea sp.]